MESSLSHRDDYEIAAAAAENGRERFSFVSFLVAFVSLSQELGTQRDHRLELVEKLQSFFQGISWSDSENIKVSYSWAKQYVSTERGKTNNSQDGSVLEEAGFAATRGIVRDRGKDWILGYNKYLGNCSVFYAKS
ncbi:hypothetical protein Goarm_011327 [Gossypium armourianum]|uniref:Uncharacterized protein n=1 Tax=Gossypium armourianum TaxID=34283 RepID=A0A7J9IWG3_9ROSI|nr:hypothetical protein [Gossypium armourianum]